MIRARSWRWFRMRLEGLVERPWHTDVNGRPVWANEVQRLVLGPLVRTDTRSEGAGP